jgi:hypothetical protein
MLFKPHGRAVVSTGRRFDPDQLHHLKEFNAKGRLTAALRFFGSRCYAGQRPLRYGTIHHDIVTLGSFRDWIVGIDDSDNIFSGCGFIYRECKRWLTNLTNDTLRWEVSVKKADWCTKPGVSWSYDRSKSKHIAEEPTNVNRHRLATSKDHLHLVRVRGWGRIHRKNIWNNTFFISC